MGKKIYLFVKNLMMCWIFLNIIPGINISKGPVAYLLISSLYAFIRLILPNTLRFFKLGMSFWGYLLVGSLLTFALFAFFQAFAASILKFGSSYYGGTDFLLFSIPKFFEITNEWIVILSSAILLNICSIILAMLAKTKI